MLRQSAAAQKTHKNIVSHTHTDSHYSWVWTVEGFLALLYLVKKDIHTMCIWKADCWYRFDLESFEDVKNLKQRPCYLVTVQFI